MAKSTHSLTFPASGDSFSVANMKNALNALHQGDFAPMRPRAHGTPDLGIMIGADGGGLIQSYYQQVYGSGDFPFTMASGDVTFAAPVSNARIDLVYASGDRYATLTGVVAATPTIPRFPSGDSVVPICLVYNKSTQTKIVNFEDAGANPNEGYIYRDVRPIMQPPTMGRSYLSKMKDVALASLASGDIVRYNSATSKWENRPLPSSAQNLVQIVSGQSVDYDSTDVLIPYDDSPPTSSEGEEEFSVSITPTSASNYLKIEVVAYLCTISAQTATIALFQDAGATAIAVAASRTSGQDEMECLSLIHWMQAGTTSSTTFKVFYGGNASTCYINGNSSGRRFGGVMASRIVVTEVVVP